MTEDTTVPTKRQPRRRATLVDIAQRAGVSVGTISAIMAGKTRERHISEQLASRVRTIASEMDYAPNLLMRSMRRGRANILSFFNGFRDRQADDLYLNALSNAIDRAAGAKGYDILTYCDFRRSTEEAYRTLNGGHSDGLIFFAPHLNDPLLPFLRQSSLPTVILGAADPENVLPSVVEDWHAGIDDLVGRLIELGHRRVAAMTISPQVNPDANSRVSYFKNLLKDAGYPIPDRWIIEVSYFKPTSWEQALRSLTGEHDPPTVLFCWNDHLGYRILESCDDLNIQVPDQLSVVGYDNLHWPAKTRHVLSSISVEKDDLAAAAVEVLDHMICRPEETPPARIPAVSFAAGTTLAPPKL